MLAGTTVAATVIILPQPGAMHLLLGAYAAFAISMVLALRFGRARWSVPATAAHAIDVAAAGWVLALAGSGSGAFFAFPLFAVIAAAYRWGLPETMATVGAALLPLWARLASDPSYPALTAALPPSVFLVVAGFVVWPLSRAERSLRAHAAALAIIGNGLQLRLGLKHMMIVVLDALMRLFGASRVVLVVHEVQTGRVFSWEGSRVNDPSPHSVRVSTIEPRELKTYMFGPTASAWHVVRRRPHQFDVVALDAHGDRCPGKRWELSADFLAAMGPFQRLMAIHTEVAAEWESRVFLVDPRCDIGRERALALARRIVADITPAVHNVYLLHRVRVRSASAERARVARELHDGVIQTVLGVQVQLHALSLQASATSPHLAAELRRLGGVLRDEGVNLRELMQQLTPVDPAPHQLMDTLADVVQRFERESGIKTRFITRLDRVDLPPRACREVTRVVQEALVNVRKHSGARSVFVRFDAMNHHYQLSVDDDGRGFPFAGRLSDTKLRQARQGPRVITERVRLLRGELTVESNPGRGARLEISLPVAGHDIET